MFILQVLSAISQEFLRSPDTTLSQLLNIKVGELVEEDEMLDSVINREKAEQLKVNTVFNLASLDHGPECSPTVMLREGQIEKK